MAKREKRDGFGRAMDAGRTAAAVAAGGGIGYAGLKIGKEATRVANAASHAAGRTAWAGREAAEAAIETRKLARSARIANAGLFKAKRWAKRQLTTFPTFGKLARAHLQARLREIQLGGDQQVVDETRRYTNPLMVAAGLRKGYRFVLDPNTGKPLREYFRDASGRTRWRARVEAVAPHEVGAQGVRAAYRIAGKARKGVDRASGLASDLGDVVSGRPRQRDAAGRLKKREWEKTWFKNAAKNTAIAGAVMGGTAWLGSKRPSAQKARRIIGRGVREAIPRINKVFPDLVPGRMQQQWGFSAKGARRVIRLESDEYYDPGEWEIRDARGRSARVFRPGSRRRVRREKRWHERVGNQRAMAALAVLAGTAAGAAGGYHARGRQMARRVPPGSRKAADGTVFRRRGNVLHASALKTGTTRRKAG